MRRSVAVALADVDGYRAQVDVHDDGPVAANVDTLAPLDPETFDS